MEMKMLINAPSDSMKSFKISPYTPDFAQEWDKFVDTARNSTFLYKRAYVDYHADRFSDASLIIRREDKTVALFIASAHPEDATISAHGGLTYGGLILPVNHTLASDVIEIMAAIASEFARRGFRRLIYKQIPYIYCSAPADDPVYALFRLGATINEVNLSTAINLADPSFPTPNPKTRRRAQHALRDGLSLHQSDNFDSFWEMLGETLSQRHNATPVHSVEEIKLLASRFPANIKLYVITDVDGRLMAGSVLYITDSVVHAQYTASTPEGRELGAVHLLYLSLRQKFTGVKQWLDFGISNEEHGRVLNTGLINQKWNYGGRPVAHYIYELQL